MVYGRFKKFARRQIRKAKRTWYGKRYMGKDPATTMRNIRTDIARVKRALNVEYKFYDRNDLSISTNAEGVGATWNIQRLNLLAQGTSGSGERLGARVKFTSLQMRMKLNKTTTATKNAVRTRVFIFIDKEPLVSGLGVAPTLDSMLQGGGNNATTAFMGQDTIRQKRFRILYDRVHTVDSDDPERFVKLYFKLGMHTDWAYGSTSGSDITNNALYIAFINDNVNGATEAVFDTRLRYVDN